MSWSWFYKHSTPSGVGRSDRAIQQTAEFHAKAEFTAIPHHDCLNRPFFLHELPGESDSRCHGQYLLPDLHPDRFCRGSTAISHTPRVQGGAAQISCRNCKEPGPKAFGSSLHAGSYSPFG